MKSQKLGCLSLSAILTALLTLVIVAIVWFVNGDEMFSPGKLNAQSSGMILGGITSHAELGSRCSACHAPFWSSQRMSDRCITCHVGLLDQPEDFHVVMFKQSETMPCQDCHTDHNGAEAALTNVELRDFPHDEVGFSLRMHTRTRAGELFACADCHPHTFSTPETALCQDCHSAYQQEFMQAHILDFPGDCLGCHDGVDRFSNFDHATVGFKLEGKHVTINCRECHQASTVLADLKGLPQDCNACHASVNPHLDQFSLSCSACHTTDGWVPSTFDHAASNFSLTGKHQQVACNDCHNRFGDSGERLYKGVPTDCLSCHADDEPHQGKFGTACQVCHTTTGWYPAEFDHNLSNFKLEGKHILAKCDACHTQQDSEGRPVYKGTPTECVACHQKDDAHAGELGTGCSDCHTPADWIPSTFDHARSSFQLTGAHVTVACQACHQQGKFKGTPATCVACHAGDDAHQGQFGKDCQTCHSTAAWQPATFDHSRSNFPLTGAHASLSCKACHTQSWKGTSSACASCHNEPAIHAGAFGTDCNSCHNTSAWKPASYKGPHSFPMNHGRANSCRDCHPNTFTKWTCYTCHNQAEIEKKHREEVSGDFSNCLRCHPDGRKSEDDD